MRHWPSLLLALIVATLVGAGAATAQPAQDRPDETAIAAMKALGRTQEQTWDLGVLDKPAWCLQRYGIAEVGFDYPSQAFYCRTRDRWIKVETGPACVAQYGEGALPNSSSTRCSRYGGPDPGAPRELAEASIANIERGTVDKPFDPEHPPTAPNPLTAAMSAPASAVSAPGVADPPGASQGPVGAFNKLPIILRVMIAGGGFMLVGVWAGGYAIRMMP